MAAAATERSGAGGHGAIELNAAHRALLELDGPPRAQQPRRELAEIGFVPDERNVLRALGKLGDGVEHLRHAAARCERIERFDAGLATDARREQFGGV